MYKKLLLIMAPLVQISTANTRHAPLFWFDYNKLMGHNPK